MLFLGVPGIDGFGYREIRAFGKRALAAALRVWTVAAHEVKFDMQGHRRLRYKSAARRRGA